MFKNERLKFYLPIIFAFVFVVGMFLGAVLVSGNNAQFSKDGILGFNFKKYDKLTDVINRISESYVDSVKKEILIDDAINGLLSKLDPHSAYIPAEDFKQMNEVLVGKFEGIGVEFRIEHDTVIVINTISGGPSEKIGIKSGDRIVRVNDTTIAGVGITNNDVIKKLKGPKNTEVKVEVFRKNISEILEFKIIRDEIPTFSLDVAYMVDNEVGYLKLNRFAATTYEEFLNAVKNLKFAGMKKLILDLRGNGGGYLNTAIGIADEFLEKDKLIVYTQGLNRSKKLDYASSNYYMKDIDFVILIDEWSASASEVLAGAMQDNDKGLVIGRRSFGKGLVQEQIELQDGSALRLTVARYYTPTGRSIQSPYSDDSEAYYLNFYKRFMDEDDKTVEKDTVLEQGVKYYTPKGRVVYGGGGITPDIIVNYNIDEGLRFFNQLANKGIIYDFAFDYADNNREMLKKTYKSANDFNARFNITALLYADFISYAKQKGIENKNNTLSQELKIKSYLKAYIGRNTFNNEAFYPNLNKMDDVFIKAVEVLKEVELYKKHQSGVTDK